MLGADVSGRRSRLLLPQNPDDLFFREPARLHVRPLPGDGLYPHFGGTLGAQLMGNVRLEAGQPGKLNIARKRLARARPNDFGPSPAGA
jgi:hypothetical protein